MSTLLASSKVVHAIYRNLAMMDFHLDVRILAYIKVLELVSRIPFSVSAVLHNIESDILF